MPRIKPLRLCVGFDRQGLRIVLRDDGFLQLPGIQTQIKSKSPIPVRCEMDGKKLVRKAGQYFSCERHTFHLVRHLGEGMFDVQFAFVMGWVLMVCEINDEVPIGLVSHE